MADGWLKGVGLLLSLEQRRAGESGLLTAVLDSRDCWAQKSAELGVVVSTHLEQGRNVEALCLLTGVIGHCSEAELTQCYQSWAGILLQSFKGCLQVPVLVQSCKGVSALLGRLHGLPLLAKQFSSEQLPVLLRALLWFAGTPAAVQCTVLPLLAQCVAAFPSACSQQQQHSTAIKEWAQAALLSDSEPLSQEGGRLLVLMSHGSADQWSSLLAALNSALQWTLTRLYKPVLHKEEGQPPQFPLPSVPATEPASTAVLLRTAVLLSCTARLCLTFPPTKAVSLPLPALLATLCLGLSLHSPHVDATLMELLLLAAVLPAVHSALWELFSALVRSCGRHLLPYAATIDGCLIQGMSCDPLESPGRTVALHSAVSAWVEIQGDPELSLLTSVVRALIKSAKQDLNVQVQRSSLNTLRDIIEVVGAVLPPVLALPLSELPYSLLPPSPSPSPLPVLKLLAACVSCGNAPLAPSLNRAFHCFAQHSTHTHSQQVREFCRTTLAQCAVLQHSLVVPRSVSVRSIQNGAAAHEKAPSLQPPTVSLLGGTTGPPAPVAAMEVSAATVESEPVVMETEPVALETGPVVLETEAVVLESDSVAIQRSSSDQQLAKTEAARADVKAAGAMESPAMEDATPMKEDGSTQLPIAARSLQSRVIEIYDSSDDELLAVLDPSSPD